MDYNYIINKFYFKYVVMENFIPYNLAVKLKEKEFNVSCIYAYCKQGGWNKYTQKHEPITYILRTDGNPFGTYYIGKNWNKEYKTNKNKIQCSAPTISQVLKWLRDEKRIDAGAIWDNRDGKWVGYVNEMDMPDLVGEYILSDTYDSYELASIAVIEYIIDNNLI